jgi:hypothetical protein
LASNETHGVFASEIAGLVLAGSGQRLIDGIDVTHLELIDSTRFGSGIIVNTYAPK